MYPCKIKGKENLIKKGKGQIYVCNHMSNVDMLYLAHYFGFRMRYLAKKELFENKFFGWVLKKIGAIPIDRDKIDLTAIKTSLGVLKDNKTLVICPEGTRNKQDENLQEIKNGAAMLAIKAKVPIVPIIVQKRAKIFRKNQVSIGNAFELDQFYSQKVSNEILVEASKIIEKNMENLKNS